MSRRPRLRAALVERLRGAPVAALVWRRHVLLAALVAGLALAPAPRWVAVAVAAVALLGGWAARRPELGVGAAVLVCAGALLGGARLHALDRTALGPAMGREIVARGYVLEPPSTRPFGGWTVALRLTTRPGAGERVVLRADEDAWDAEAGAGERAGSGGGDAVGPAAGAGKPAVAPGAGTGGSAAEVGVAGSGAGGGGGGDAGTGADPAPQIGEEVVVRGRFAPLAEWEGYQRLRGAHAALEADSVAPTGRRRGGIPRFVDAVRRRAVGALDSGLAPAQAALARGMVLGDDSALSGTVRDDFRASGLSHLLAASGANVALVAALAIAVLTALGAGLRTRLAGALALVVLYVPLAGSGPSIQRAGVMGGAALVAGLAGRPTSRAYALLLAAAATLALNPRADEDVGWQLSFAAVVAIALLAPRWRARLTERGVPERLSDALALTAAATLGTAPLLALHFERISLVSLPANVVVAPAVAPIVWLGAAAGALAQIGAPADLLAAASAPLLGFVGAVAHAAARAPHATIAAGLGGPAGVAAAYAALGALAASCRARALAAGALAAVVVAAAWARGHPPHPPRDLTISFLDVGQGDATLVQHGAAAILVDTGPPDAPIAARLRAAGVRRLDLLVLTHGQADHDGATAAILHAVPVGAILDGTHGDPAAAAPGVRRIVPVAGEVLRDGPLRLRVLWPGADAPDTGDPNDRAIVALLRDGGFSALLTADAESDVTGTLSLPPVDVLKVAHHGSADPGLPELLRTLRPKLAAIEVGRDNAYGHPSPATLRALHAAVPDVLRTDRDGTIRVTLRDGAMTVDTHAG